MKKIIYLFIALMFEIIIPGHGQDSCNYQCRPAGISIAKNKISCIPSFYLPDNTMNAIPGTGPYLAGIHNIIRLPLSDRYSIDPDEKKSSLNNQRITSHGRTDHIEKGKKQMQLSQFIKPVSTSEQDSRNGIYCNNAPIISKRNHSAILREKRQNSEAKADSGDYKSIKKDPVNPHYFNYKGITQPLIGTGGGNCYGFVINSNFNYHIFFDYIQKYRLNYISVCVHQVFTSDWQKRLDLPLAPVSSTGILQPWQFTDQINYGGFWPRKFDLDLWNNEYFSRLKDFINCAAQHDVVVNVFFDDLISQADINIVAFNPDNNINDTENTGPAEYFTIAGHPVLTAYHDRMIAKIVKELNYADNIIYFICDEPGHAGHGRDSSYYHKVYDWLSHKIDVIINTEKTLPKKHPVASQQQMCAYPLDFSGDKRTDYNVHQYTWWGSNHQTGGLKALDEEYYHNKPLDFNETKNIRKDTTGSMFYPGDQVLCQRLDMWSFMLGGGASFLSNNKEFTLSAPTGLNIEFNNRILSGIKCLRDFLDSISVVNMTKSDMKWIKLVPSAVSVRAIEQKGIQYALYMHHSTFKDRDSSRYYPDNGGFASGTITVNLPAGNNYSYVWIEPESNKNIGQGRITGGTDIKLNIPSYSIRPDIALRIKKIQERVMQNSKRGLQTNSSGFRAQAEGTDRRRSVSGETPNAIH
jgi:hypothetical protein